MAAQSQGMWSRAHGPPSDKNICTTVLESQLEGQMDLPAVMFMVLIDLRFITTGIRQTNTSTHVMSVWCTPAHGLRRSRQQDVSGFPWVSSQCYSLADQSVATGHLREIIVTRNPQNS